MTAFSIGFCARCRVLLACLLASGCTGLLGADDDESTGNVGGAPANTAAATIGGTSASASATHPKTETGGAPSSNSFLSGGRSALTVGGTTHAVSSALAGSSTYGGSANGTAGRSAYGGSAYGTPGGSSYGTLGGMSSATSAATFSTQAGGVWNNGGSSAHVLVGGTAATLGGSSNGGASSASVGGASSAGTGLAEFCVGQARVRFKDQTSEPTFTHHTPMDIRSCCQSFGMRIHTSATAGTDLFVLISHNPSPTNVGTFELVPNDDSAEWSVRVVPSMVTYYASAGYAAAGKLIVSGDLAGAWQMGLCIEVTDGTMAGTRIYQPGLPMDSVSTAARFEIRLLTDKSITAIAASQQPLASLNVDDTVLLSLSSIDYIQASTGSVGFPPQNVYSWLHDQLGTVGVNGLPFVVLADGERIYMGGFFPAISSMAIPNPEILTDDISSDGLTIGAPYVSGSVTDPRFDARIVKVLKETARYLP